MTRKLLATTAGSLPKPNWLAEPETLWPKWKLADEQLWEGQQKSALEHVLEYGPPRIQKTTVACVCFFVAVLIISVEFRVFRTFLDGLRTFLEDYISY